MLAAPLPTTDTAATSWGEALAAALEAANATQGVTDDPLDQRRANARRRLQEQPLPSRRLEDWRFTDTSSLAAIRPRPIDAEGRSLQIGRAHV